MASSPPSGAQKSLAKEYPAEVASSPTSPPTIEITSQALPLRSAEGASRIVGPETPGTQSTTRIDSDQSLQVDNDFLNQTPDPEIEDELPEYEATEASRRMLANTAVATGTNIPNL
jgi:hypothetical protein